MVRAREEICDLIDRSDEELKKILKNKEIALALKLENNP